MALLCSIERTVFARFFVPAGARLLQRCPDARDRDLFGLGSQIKYRAGCASAFWLAAHSYARIAAGVAAAQVVYSTRDAQEEGDSRDKALGITMPRSHVSPPTSMRPNALRRTIRLMRRLSTRLFRRTMVIGIIPTLGARYVATDVSAREFEASDRPR